MRRTRRVRLIAALGVGSLVVAGWLFPSLAGRARALPSNRPNILHANEPTSGPILCLLDAGPSVDCSNGTFIVNGLAHTDHTLAVTASDTLGNVGTTTYSWHVK